MGSSIRARDAWDYMCGTIYTQNCRGTLFFKVTVVERSGLVGGATVLVVRTCRTVNFA